MERLGKKAPLKGLGEQKTKNKNKNKSDGRKMKTEARDYNYDGFLYYQSCH